MNNRTIKEIRDSYNSYSTDALQNILNEQRSLCNEAADTFEAAREYERVNHIIEKRFQERYGNEPHKYGGRYGDLYKRPDYSKWKDTFYDKERLFIEEHLVQKVHPLSRVSDLIAGKSDIPELDAYHLPIKACIMGYCDYAKESKNGPILHLIDPDGEYTTPPHFGMSNEMGDVYAGKICVLSMKFQKGTVPQILAVATLPFTLTERIKPGTPQADNLTEPPFPLEKGSKPSDWEDFLN